MLGETDYTQQLADYIKRNIAKGYTLEALKWALISQGYTRVAVEKAIKIANQQLAESAPKMKEKPVIKREIIKVEAASTKSLEDKKSKRGFFEMLRLKKRAG